MNDEIKEILDKLKNRKEETLIAGLRECQLKNIEHVFITKEEYIDKVLDYITNLQQELKYQEEAEIEYNEKHTKLMEDFKKIKEENESLKEGRKYLLGYKNEDYKSRIEKAVEIYDDTITYLTTINAEYMDSNTKRTIQDVVNKLEKELNILLGRSDE